MSQELTPMQLEIYHMAGIAERADLGNLAAALRGLGQRVHGLEWEVRVLKQGAKWRAGRTKKYKSRPQPLPQNRSSNGV